MLREGVIMDVVNAEQARITEESGAVAVMALECVTADIRAEGGVARMSDPGLIKEIKKVVTIPVMAKARIGHFSICAPLELVKVTKQLEHLPVIDFAARGVATPADATLMMQMGCDGVFVGSDIFKSAVPAARERVILKAVTHYNDSQIIAEVSCNLGDSMAGLNLSDK
ncbi:hypothetical protein KP509_05G057700 [Ceratopteris richardii]|uniref:pyridoxal 5'-phosphate synthase (glutamine hydrolyzing) n=1 Tax=Ceratopteris richardii TaxID=49495 RepID=A0A8T2UR91_CERRI|nr:hypothetical protein KP509_05G057700 [Ceratopteris richardii]